ncbi:hypothetical protein [Burkholderia gladioli]|uniref:hypothetical protein n=1 Tax=Burkholderia gladioli TaxID=28095 RepID=UPI00163E69CA|nr:hypothetical protein [Burkholderia gladioli]
MRATNDNDLLAAARVNRSLAWLFAVGYGVLVGLGWYGTVQIASMLRCSTPFDWLGDLLERLHKRSPVAGYLVAVLIAAGATYVIARLNQDGMSAPRVWGA